MSTSRTQSLPLQYSVQQVVVNLCTAGPVIEFHIAIDGVLRMRGSDASTSPGFVGAHSNLVGSSHGVLQPSDAEPCEGRPPPGMHIEGTLGVGVLATTLAYGK